MGIFGVNHIPRRPPSELELRGLSNKKFVFSFKNHYFLKTFTTQIIPYNFRRTGEFGLEAHKYQSNDVMVSKRDRGLKNAIITVCHAGFFGVLLSPGIVEIC